MDECEINNSALPKPLPSPQLVNDAAAWLLSLNGPTRDEAMERGFMRWLKEDPMHAVAFREVSRDYQHIGEHKHDAYIAVGATPLTGAPLPPPKERLLPKLALAAVVAAAIFGAWLHFSTMNLVATNVGEQRSVLLSDGTKVYLNTSTRIVVRYENARREVRLSAGEALFEVAKDARRPFVVVAGDRKVTALGTAFLVRRDIDRLAVTLVEGKVSIASLRSAEPNGGAALLAPGERMTFRERQTSAQLDRPTVQKLLAWQQGRIAIDDMQLSDAVAEMNRYSPTKLRIQDPDTEHLMITGAFIAGQSANFAQAVALTYGLKVIDEGSVITLAARAKPQALAH